MKYTEKERLDIGRQVYNQELTLSEAQEKYQIDRSTVQLYIHNYKVSQGIPVKSRPASSKAKKVKQELDIEAYRSMSKEELIRELILSKANELRAKKGYEVKGDGASKEYSSLSNKNFK